MIEDRKKTGENALVLLAAGTGSRMGGENKLTRDISGKNAIELCLEVAEKSRLISYIVVIVNKHTHQAVKDIISAKTRFKRIAIVSGGDTRGESVWKGLESLAKLAPNIVAIHDCARPFVSAELIDRSIEVASEKSCAIAAVRLIDSIKRVDEDLTIFEDIDRDGIWRMQTPQSFDYDEIVGAYRDTNHDFSLSDDAAIWTKSRRKAYIVEGDESNFKITNERDLKNARDVAKNNRVKPGVRIGFGEDIHILADNRKLILGGVEILFKRGLFGHSDADVLVHAICDALLGALSMGDIGQHFPDTCDEYKGVNSMELLKKVSDMVSDKGYELGNIDSVVMAQEPKLAPYIELMRENIANVLRISLDRVSVKATTSEGVNAEGEGKAISAKAIVLLQRTRD